MKRKFQPVFTHEKELTAIKDLISENPEGLNIKQISEAVYMNRNSVAKYLDMLMMSGQVELRQIGNSKLYYPSHRVPVSKILNYSSELVVFIDRHHCVIQVNDPFLEFIGRGEDDILEHEINELDIPVLNDPYIRNLIENVLEGHDAEAEVRVTVSGAFVFFHAKLIPIVFDDGSNGAALFMRDITDQKHAEDALNVSEERYKNIVETQTEFISRFIPNGTHLFVNEAYCRYFGKTREEIMGSKFRPGIPAEDLPQLKRHFAGLTKENPSASIEHRVIMPDGSIRWQVWIDKAIFDENGDLIEYQSVGRDTTERKETEDAIQENEQRLFNILHGSPIPTYVIDRDHRIIFWNHALEVLSEIDAEGMLGTRLHWKAFYRNERPCLSDLLVDNAHDKIHKWYAGKYTESVLVDDAYEVVDYFPDLGPSGKWLRITSALIRNSSGEPVGVRETLEDISERKEAGLALRESEQWIFSVIQSSPIPTYVIDRDHRIIFWNRALEMLSEIDAVGMLGTRLHWKAFYRNERPCLSDLLVDNAHDKIHEWYAGKYTESALLDDAYEVVDYFPDLGPSGKWLRITSALIRNSSGEPVGVRETLEDISEKHEAKIAVERLKNHLFQVFSFMQCPVFAIDTGGVVTYWNPAMEKLTGISAEDMIGRGDYEYSIPFYNSKRPLLVNLLFESVKDIEESGYARVIRDGPVLSAEASYVDLDGNSRLLSTRAIPVYDPNGRFTGAIESVRDITEERLNEEILRLNEEKYRELAEILPLGVYEMDVNGRIVWANLKALGVFGYKEDDMKAGINLYQLFMGEDRKRALDELGSVKKSSDEGTEYTAMKKDGTSVRINVHSIPVISERKMAGRICILIS